MTKQTPAAEQFAAMRLPEADWTDAMRLAVRQKWSGLEVDVPVDSLRRRITEVVTDTVPTVDEMVAEWESVNAEVATAEVRDRAALEHKRLKRNAAVNAWRERNRLQAALDARDLKFARLRATKGKAATPRAGSETGDRALAAS